MPGSWIAWLVSVPALSADLAHVWDLVERPAGHAVAAYGPPPPPRRQPLADVDPAEFDIPIDLTPEVEAWVTFFTEGGGRYSFQRWLDRAPAVQPLMWARLEAAGLPRDLVYLSMVESGYDATAYSRADAAGLWQFIEPTARAYGLRIDDWRDERYSPARALDAAIAYLSDLHDAFGDWRLAWAAYNTGPSRVRRALERVDGGGWWAIARGGHVLPETREYVPIIMAAAIVGHAPEQYGFVPAGEPPSPPDAVTVQALDLACVAGALDVSLDELQALNPELRRAVTPPGRFGLQVPAGRGSALRAQLAVQPRQCRADPGHLARQADERPASRKPAKPAKPPDRDAGWMTYAVRRGDSLGRIAQTYGVTVSELKAWNLLRGASVRPGQRLRIRRPGS